MPIAILSRGKSYLHPAMFGRDRLVPGDEREVSEEQAEELHATGLFDIIEDGTPASRRRLGTPVRRKGIVIRGKEAKTESAVEV